jgi:tetratricopeptide (TPR) repeat protein
MNQTTYPGTMAAHADSLQFMQKIVQVDTTLSRDPFAALGLSNDLLSLATTLGSHSWYVAKAHERIGASYYYLDDLDKSNTHYYKALLLFDSLGDLSGEALTLNNLGWNYRVQEKNDLAISCFLRSLEIYEQRGDWEHVQGVLNNLGTAYRREPGMEKEALEVYKKSLKINQNTGNRTWEAYNYNNIGLIHLDIKKNDSAIYYFQKAALENQDMGNQEQYCLNQLNLGLAFLEKDMLDSAEVYFQISKSILDKHDFPKTAYVYDDYQYALQLKKKNYQAALDFFIRKTAYEQAQQRQESEDIIHRTAANKIRSVKKRTGTSDCQEADGLAGKSGDHHVAWECHCITYSVIQ